MRNVFLIKMDSSRLNDQRLLDYANSSPNAMNQMREIAKQKYDYYKSNPQCGEYLAYYGEIFALELYIKDNPNFNRQLLIERAKQSGQWATVKFLNINLDKDNLFEIAQHLSYSDLNNFIKANYLEKDSRFMNLLTNKHVQKPKRNKTAFLFFAEENRDRIQRNNPHAKMTEISRYLGIEWDRLRDKTRYETLAFDDKKRYDSELINYKSWLENNRI